MVTNSKSAYPLRMPQMGPPPSTPGPGSLAQDVERHFMEGEKVAAFYRGLGINPSWGQTSPTKAEEKTSTTVDLGGAFKAMADQNQNMLNAVLGMSQNTKTAKEDPFLQYMMTELKEMRQELLRAKEHPQTTDPWQAIDTYASRYDGLMQKFKKDLHLPDNYQIGTGNDQVAVQLKNLDLQQKEREFQFEVQKHQWEVERDDRTQQRLEDSRRFNMEYNLKVQEIKDKQARSDNASSWIQDLAGAFIGSIDPSAAPPLNVAQAPAPPPQQTVRTKSFQCVTLDCKTQLEVPVNATEDTEIVCPTCQMVYGMQPEGNKPAESPAEPLAPAARPEELTV